VHRPPLPSPPDLVFEDDQIRVRRVNEQDQGKSQICEYPKLRPSIAGMNYKLSSVLYLPYSIRDALKRLERRIVFEVPLRGRCSFGWFPWLISQALRVTYVTGEHRLYLEGSCWLSESPAHRRRRHRGATCQFQGAEQSTRVRPGSRTSAKIGASIHELSRSITM